ncbi:MAG: DUF4870 domain-containing protein [Planctomycetota bacterium]|nr:MAG: DUF4870 domain-containing protein [Planctomycetota bacterium]
MSQVPHEPHEEEYPVLSADVRNWAMLCHLSALLAFIPPFVGVILGPLLLWLIKGKEHPYIDEHGKESLNFQISIIIYSILLIPTVCIGIGVVLLPALWLADAVLIIMAAMKASNGEAYRYPMCIRLVQ